MKYQVSVIFSAIFAVVLTLASGQAMASGCGGPEYSIEKTAVISTSLIKNSVESKDILLMINTKGPVQLELTLFSKILPVKDSPYFFWHTLRLDGQIPANFSLEKLNRSFNEDQATIDLVKDSYFINCGNPAYDDEQNLRIQLRYEDTVLTFRTDYVPDSNPW